MLAEERQRHADGYLHNIINSLQNGTHYRPRDVFDPWFAFETGNDPKTGATFLTRGGKPHTFDNPCPRQHWRTLRHSHFWVTPAASEILSRAESGDRKVRKDQRDKADEGLRLVVEHAVPLARIGKELAADERVWTADALRSFLLHHFRRGVLTKIEDRKLNATSFKGYRLSDDMPSGWRVGEDPLSRYRMMNPQLERVSMNDGSG